MTSRYVLRFDSGERQGETVPLNVAPGAAFSIGRKPGCSLQVVEVSVSGRHAELTVEADGVRVRDLDSTNGMRVAGERVRTGMLRHGDEFALGNVLFTLLDEAAAGRVDAPALPSVKPNVRSGALPISGSEVLARTQVQPREEVLEISAADLARSKRGSKGGLIALAVLVAAGAGVWFWSQGRSGGDTGRAGQRPVVAPEGNLLDKGYSFESENGWTSDEGAASVFRTTRGARASGELGLVVELGAESATGEDGDEPDPGQPAEQHTGPDFALHRSDVVRVRAGTELEAQASVRTSGAAQARLGLRFEGSGEYAPAPFEVWSDPIESEAGHELFAFKCVVPPACDRVSLVLAAESAAGSAGEVALDDVSLVPTGTPREVPRVGVWELVALGTPPRGLVLAKVDRVLVSGLRCAPADDESGAAGSSRATLALGLEPSENGFTLRFPRAATLTFHGAATLVADGLATLGEGGYLAHSATFERTAVTDLLLGKDADLVRVSFDRPVAVRGTAEGDGSALHVALAGAEHTTWQLRFDEDRVQAAGAAREAREARRAGRPGVAFAAWGDLLARYPFDQALVDEAASARGEIVREGLVELRAQTRDLERARSFRLVDLYDDLARRAHDLATRFAGSEVEGRARELAATLATERGVLAQDLDRYERQRLTAIATYLEQSESPTLAREVRDYLAELAARASGPAAGTQNGGQR
jgi:hypothetical protein